MSTTWGGGSGMAGRQEKPFLISCFENYTTLQPGLKFEFSFFRFIFPPKVIGICRLT